MAKTEREQIIFKEGTRLLCNVILYYNSTILSRIYTQLLKKGNHRLIAILKHISPAAWININLYESFELKDEFKTETIPSFNVEEFDELLKNDPKSFA